MRNILSLIFALIICVLLVGCSSGNTQSGDTGNNSAQKNTPSVQTSLGLDPQINLSVGETRTVAFKVNSTTNITETQLNGVIENPSVADMKYQRIDSNYVYFEITAKSEGTTNIYLELNDTKVKSETITLSVINKAPDYIIGAIGESENNKKSNFTVIEGRTKEICFAVLGANLIPENVQIVVENGEILEATYRRVNGQYVYYLIKALEPGSTMVYLETVDGLVQSPPVTVTVIAKGEIPEDDEDLSGYVANKNSKIFHYAYCSFVDQINDANKLFFDCDRDYLLSEEFTPCETCKP